jgi:hypothetical protein
MMTTKDNSDHYNSGMITTEDNSGGHNNSPPRTNVDNVAVNTIVDNDNLMTDTIANGNEILVDIKKETILSEDKGNDQYNSEMMTAEGQDNVDTFTMKDNATENTRKAIGNSRNTSMAKERMILVEDKEHSNYNSGTIIAEDDLILAVCTSVLDSAITKIQRMDKKEKRGMRQMQKATTSGTYHGQRGTTQQVEPHAAKKADPLSLERTASMQAIESGMPMMYFNDWVTQSTTELCQALWEGRLSHADFIQALIDISKAKYGNGVDTPEGPSSNCYTRHSSSVSSNNRDNSQKNEKRPSN